LGVFLGTSLYTLYLPTWLEDRGATAGQVASLFAIGGIATVLAGPQAGKLSDRIGRKRLIIGSSVALALLMLATTPLIRGFWAACVLFFALMALIAARASPLQALLTEIVPEE
jgi:MFS family permease